MTDPDHQQPDDPAACGESDTPASEAGAVAATPGAIEPHPVSAAELEELRAQAAKAADHWDHYLRARADLDNYRKRATRERQEAVRYAQLGLIEKLIPVLDHFDMALAAVNNTGPGPDAALRDGIAMIQGQLRAVLTAAGVQEIDATGQVFDPNVHEAVSQLESAEVPEGQVLQQVRKGYRLHERLVRPASVIVARPPAA